MNTTRRAFLKVTARIAALGAMVYMSLKLGRRASFKVGETCVNDFICRGCSVYTGCGLPQALSAKKAGVR